MDRGSDVIVVGGGVVGAAIAWRAGQRGLRVTLVDPAPGSGATPVAAGMLAPVSEAEYGEQAVIALNLASAARYPAFVAELEAATGRQVGYRPCGTLVIAWTAGDLAALRDLHAFQRSLGLAADLVGRRELRALEPALAPGLAGALLAPGDHQVDNRRLHAALLAAVRQVGVEQLTAPVAALRVLDGRVQGVELAGGGFRPAGTVVVAAGAWTGTLAGLPASLRPAVRPVKGQTVRLRGDDPGLLSHVVRGRVHGRPVYVVPRADGELVIGATSEEAGFDVRPRAGAVYELLRDAQTLLPELGEAWWQEVSTGLRPGTPDNLPLIGPAGVDGLLLAAGHYRHGILLTPVTADAVVALLTDGEPPPEVAGCRPLRFAGQPPAVPSRPGLPMQGVTP